MGKATILCALGLVLCVVILEHSVSARINKYQDDEVTQEEKLFEEWLEHLRPGMMSVVEQRAQMHKKKADPKRYLDRERSMFDIMRMFMMHHGSDVNDKIEAMFSKYQTETVTDTDSKALVCQNEQQCVNRTSDPVEQWRKFSKSIRDEPSSCAPCQFLISGLQDTACTTPWETIRDDLINLCENLLFPLIDLDPVMCNGTVDLQGQHIYCVVKEASAYDFCEGLGMCYPAEPAKTELPPVSERTPWALKETLQPKLQKVLAKKQKKAAKRSRRQANTVRIVQMTDIHMQPKYTIGAPTDCKAAICCLADSIPRDGTNYARKWGEYTCNVPERTMEKFLQRTNDFNPDLVIYAGDSPPHTLWDETLTSQANCSNIVVNAMQRNLAPGTKVYPNIGNHEMYPTNLYSKRLTETAEMNQALTNMWRDLAGFDQTAEATFNDMSYYSILHQPGLRVMSINSNYDWYNANFYNCLNTYDEDNAGHKQFVEDTLANARANNEKVVIVSHHPVHSGLVRTVRWWQEVMAQYADVVVLHVSGHTHNDEFDLILDPTTGDAIGVNLVAPTVTTNTNINPSLKVFDLDATTFELVDSNAFYFDLVEQNPDQDPDIVLNYNTKEEYNMTDLSPAAWQDLVLRFIDDEALFQAYYANRHAMAPRGPCLLDNICGEGCKISQICGMWFPSDDEASECQDSWNATLVANVKAVQYNSAATVMAGVWMVLAAFVANIFV